MSRIPPVSAGKCLLRLDIPRVILAAALLAGTPSRLEAQDGILPRDAAARAYEQGLDALRRRDYPRAVERLKEALATGHVRPELSFGTSRFPVGWYDPWYWLGVAEMELGHDAEARADLERSKAAGVIQTRPEYADLLARLDRLARAAPAVAAAQAETPAVPTPLPSPSPVPAPTAPTGRTPPAPTPPAPTPPAPAGPARGTPTLPDLTDALAALSAGRWNDAEEALARLRQQGSPPREADLLEAVLYGTRYLLEGRKDPALLQHARASLATYRRRGGSRRAEESWISPSLARALRGQ